jgi:hypothetical protein
MLACACEDVTVCARTAGGCNINPSHHTSRTAQVQPQNTASVEPPSALAFDLLQCRSPTVVIECIRGVLTHTREPPPLRSPPNIVSVCVSNLSGYYPGHYFGVEKKIQLK